MAPPPGSDGIRKVVYGEWDAKVGETKDAKYPDNTVTTSKYTVLNFVPKNLFEQLQKAANVYFLIISIVMKVGEDTNLYVESIKAYSTALTLMVMMAWSALMAGVDDYFRHKSDNAMNHQVALTFSLQQGKLVPDGKAWAEVSVGDVLLVKGEQEVPADMVPLACSGDEGVCYVSTANLDGETNLKVKAAVSSSQKVLCAGGFDASGSEDPLLDTVLKALSKFECSIEAEAPQRSIHTFNGAIQSAGGEKEALSQKQLLLRGTTLRNTAWAIGIVVYTGKQTRVVMNSRKTPMKLANLEKAINRTLLVVLFVQFALAVISDVKFITDESTFRGYNYINVPNIDLPTWLGFCITFFVLYSNLMPISLYATMEVCNTAQSYFVKNDLEMYDEESDSAAIVRSTNLCQELGQVEYIFSDKTGTLTQNVMELKRVYIDGQIYGEVTEDKGFNGADALQKAMQKDPKHAAIADAFLEVLAVSHTVVINTDKNGNAKLEAESPDEGALVEAVGELGWKFTGRNQATIEVDQGWAPGNPKNRSYTVLALNAFNSTRKRMSVIVRADTGEHFMLAKGADNVMLERASNPDQKMIDALSDMAVQGLRTLVIGRRNIPPDEFSAWSQEYEAALCAIDDREGKLMAVAEKIETGMELVGATAIEDKLQVGVGETIARVRGAGIKLWVLTGDKLETARNIGFSTNVLTTDMEILILDLEDSEGESVVRDKLREMDPHTQKAVADGVVLGLMVTGRALEMVTENGMDSMFLEVGKRCSVVIACRVSPLQKAQVVGLVRKGIVPQPVTLAIGDGANDVPMIQEAQVGVGIVGKEGRQAVNAADFAIGQFRFLQRLLLVHGRWNYRRACKFILYTFWRNAVQVLLMFYFSFICGSSGTTIFEDKVRMTFNVILSIPIIATGCFDKDVPDHVALKTPILYDVGRKQVDLNALKMVLTLASATVHSLIILAVCLLAFPGMSLLEAGDVYSWGTALYSCLIIDMNYRCAFLTTTWNKVVALFLAASFGLYLLFCLVYGMFTFGTPYMLSVTYKMASNLVFWFCLIATPLLCMAFDFLMAYIGLQFRPDTATLVLECEKAGRTDFTLVIEPPKKETRPSPTSPRDATPVRENVVPLVPAIPKQSFQMKGSFSSFNFDHPEGDARSPANLKVAHPKAGDTSCVDTMARQSSFRNVKGAKVSVGPTAMQGGEMINRPPNKPLAQQKLPAFQFVLTVKLVLVGLISAGLLLVLLGGLALMMSGSTAQVRVQYDGTSGSYPSGTKNAEMNTVSCKAGNTCTFNLAVPDDMEPPIWVYYILDPFYQNYNTYLQSVAQQFKDKEINAATAAFIAQLDSFEVVGYPSTPKFDNVAWKSDIDRFSVKAGSSGERSIAWMRPGAMEHVVKRYMRLDTKLAAGSEISLRINSSLNADMFGARKEVFLTTLSPLGGRDSSFGMLLLIGGCICLGISFFVISIQLISPRRPGEQRFKPASAAPLPDRIITPEKDPVFTSQTSEGSIADESLAVTPATLGAPVEQNC